MNTSALLEVRNLSVRFGEKTILNGIDLTVGAGEIHAIMGPNGSGKSTLASAIMGHPSYTVTSRGRSMLLAGENLSPMSTDERAKKGVFLAFQSPVAVPGVSVTNLLRSALGEREVKGFHKKISAGSPIVEFLKGVRSESVCLGMDPALLSRGVNDGFSGGERKKSELLQALALKPKLVIFDEIDTGLDVDALKVVAEGIRKLADAGSAVIIITHYQRILKYLTPNRVHILAKGKIIKSGPASLAKKIEEEGYRTILRAS